MNVSTFSAAAPGWHGARAAIGPPPLRCRETRHASDPEPGAWISLFPAPHENRGFVEGVSYAFELPAPGWSLRIDDEPIETRATGGGVAWTPGFYAGEVTAEVIQPDGRGAALVLLDVAPRPDKLGREIFARMVDDLWHEDPSLIAGAEPAASPIGDRGHAVHNPWLAFARLRRHAPSLIRALAAVQARPRQGLRSHRESVALHRVRRIDRRSAMNILRVPAVARALFASGADTAGEASCLIDIARVDTHLDVAANRTMLSLVLAVVRRARWLLEVLAREVEHERASETQTPLAHRWPARKAFLEELVVLLTSVLRRQPFSEVRRAEMTSAGLTAVTADPEYARAWNCGWRALRDGMDAERRDERLWMSPTWQIYERWCFLRVSTLVRSMLPHLTWRRESHPGSDRARWIGSSDRRTLIVAFQPMFRAHPHRTDGAWSVSMQRQPDLMILRQDEDGVRYVILDAKYRRTRHNVLDAMTSAHLYRDALRIGRTRPDASLLLVPAGGGAPWLEDPSFQDEHRVGVCPLCAGEDERLPKLVHDLLRDLLGDGRQMSK